jgi:hypothetical protein
VVANETRAAAATHDDTAAAIHRFGWGSRCTRCPWLPEGALDQPVMAALADLMW